MKIALTCALMVGLAVGYLIPRNEAIAHTSQSDCEASNPYGSENIPGPPQGPIECPLGTHIDWNCVQAATDSYNTSVNMAYGVAYAAYTSACELHESDVSNCETLCETCILTRPVRECYDDLVTCIDTADGIYAASKDAAADTLADAVSDATATYWSDVSECCVEDLYMLQKSNMQDNFCADTNPFSDPSTFPGVPQGPIECPVGTHIDWDCVKEATKKYENDIAELYGLAAGWYDKACGAYIDELDAADAAFEACVLNGLPETLCAQAMHNAYKAASNVFQVRVQGQIEDVNEWTQRLSDQYWKDVSHCCVKDDV